MRSHRELSKKAHPTTHSGIGVLPRSVAMRTMSMPELVPYAPPISIRSRQRQNALPPTSMNSGSRLTGGVVAAASATAAAAVAQPPMSNQSMQLSLRVDDADTDMMEPFELASFHGPQQDERNALLMRHHAGGNGGAALRHTDIVNSGKLKTYHHLCQQRLEQTMERFRVREARERANLQSRALCAAANRKQMRRSSLDASNDRQWKLIRDRRDIRVYRHVRRKQRMSTLMALGTLHGSLSDVMNGLYAETTKEARVMHTLLSPKLIDTRILYVDKCETDQEPSQFAGITWTALKALGLGVGISRPRDFLCFKKMDFMKDDNGDEMAYLVLQSIDGAAAVDEAHVTHAAVTSPPSPRNGTRYVRGYISMAVILKKMEGDRVSVFMHGEFNARGRLPPRLGDRCFADSIVAIANSVQCGQAKNLSVLLQTSSAAPLAMGALFGPPPTEFQQPNKPAYQNQQPRQSNQLSLERDHCAICDVSIFFWSGAAFCRGCWQRTCRSCRVKKPIFCAHYHRSHAGKRARNKPCTESFCLQCVCSVLPSNIPTNARLLTQLEKKRKRAAGNGSQQSNPRQTLSSLTEDSVLAFGGLHSFQGIEQQSRTGGDVSTISVISSRESEKHQQHRLSLPRPRRISAPYARASIESASQLPPPRPQSQHSSVTDPSMLEVVEHYQSRYGGTSTQSYVSGAMSSSVPSINYSISSNEVSTTTARLGGGGVTDTAAVHRHPAALAAALRTEPKPIERRGPNAKALPPTAPPTAARATNAVSGSGTHDDEYYEKLLQRYLRSMKSQGSDYFKRRRLSNENAAQPLRTADMDRADAATIQSILESMSAVSSSSSLSGVASDIVYRHFHRE